jgi:hypothetical protein
MATTLFGQIDVKLLAYFLGGMTMFRAPNDRWSRSCLR